MRWLYAGLIGVFFYLQFKLWVGDGSLAEVRYLENQIEQQSQENQALLERNERLQAEVHDLKSGKEALEERARNELGMVRKGETFFYLVPIAKPAAESSASQ